MAHDEGEQTPLAADISLWKFFRSTGTPPVGASEPDVDVAFDRIIRGAQRSLRLADALEEIASIADDYPGFEGMERIFAIADAALYGGKPGGPFTSMTPDGDT